MFILRIDACILVLVALGNSFFSYSLYPRYTLRIILYADPRIQSTSNNFVRISKETKTSKSCDFKNLEQRRFRTYKSDFMAFIRIQGFLAKWLGQRSMRCSWN